MNALKLGSGSKKIKKEGENYHKSNMFLPEQEQRLVTILESFLATKGRPKNIDPIQRIITKFCRDHQIKLKGANNVSQKKAYAILNRHMSLKRLYWPERFDENASQVSSQDGDNQSTIGSATMIPDSPTSFPDAYNENKYLKSVISKMEHRVNSLEQNVSNLLTYIRSLPNQPVFNDELLPGFPGVNINQKDQDYLYQSDSALNSNYESFDEEPGLSDVFLSDKDI